MTKETFSTILSLIESIRNTRDTYDCLMQTKNLLLEQCDHVYPSGMSAIQKGNCTICSKRMEDK